ncbi:hypothetical protein SCHPADRAFT_652845 [Schizopora paradoxa]|uniref:Uncharacterized protein n=1 Tax=Schizopora paradoxa TaxID=27342 RepID=A0A0H2RR93_9AGAM|nr:hypothetical protein SCHPADRAFT_652845 [Schizopora paradoxa]
MAAVKGYCLFKSSTSQRSIVALAASLLHTLGFQHCRVNMSLGSTHSPTRTLELGSQMSSGSSDSNSSSTRTARTDDVDDSVPVTRRGGLRSSIVRFGGLKMTYLKVVPERFLSPKQIANELRRLRGNDSLSIHQRHKNYHDIEASYPNIGDMIPLCARLIDLACRARDIEKCFLAQSEFLRLYAEDPIFYELYRHCSLTSKERPYDVSYFNYLILEEERSCCRWSILLGTGSFGTNVRSETAQSNCDALKKTFTSCKRETFELGIVYIAHAMKLKFQDEDLTLLRQLWDHFLNCFAKASGVEPWIDCIDLCFKNIVSSGKSLADFASPLQLGRIATKLVENAAKAPFIFSTFYAIPKIELRGPKASSYGATFVHHYLGCNWDIITASTYAMAFMTNTMLNDISSPNNDKPLERTVFANSTIMGLYNIIYTAMLDYRRTSGVLCSSTPRNSVHYARVALLDQSLQYITVTNTSKQK